MRKKWFRRLLAVTGVILFPLLIWTLLNRLRPLPTRPPPPTLSIERIQTLSSLVTAKVEMADVVFVRKTGLTGGISVAAVVKGDYLLGTDLAAARFEQVDPDRRSAVIVLAPVRATSPRVDLERTRLFALNEHGLWQLAPGDSAHTAVVNEVLRQAQLRISASAEDATAMASARDRVEQLLRSFYQAVGWDVSARWTEDRKDVEDFERQ